MVGEPHAWSSRGWTQHLLNRDSSGQVADQDGAVHSVCICGEVHLGLGSTRSLQAVLEQSRPRHACVLQAGSHIKHVLAPGAEVWPHGGMHALCRAAPTMMEI